MVALAELFAAQSPNEEWRGAFAGDQMPIQRFRNRAEHHTLGCRGKMLHEAKQEVMDAALDRSLHSGHEKKDDAGLLLPEQYVDLIRRNHVFEGELKLLLAVLEDAIRCYLLNANRTNGQRRQEFVEVTSWFEGDNGARRADIFSFENLCAALGIEPRGLRARLRFLTIADLPTRRYQMRRHRPLSSLRDARDRRRRSKRPPQS